MIAFGSIPVGSVLPVVFDAFAAATGASITLTGLAVTDIEIYKGTSMTQRSSDAGYTLLDTDGIDLDGITGIHGFSIDTGDNTDAGFFVAGSFYTVVVSAVTIDGQTVNFVAATFRLLAAENVTGYPLADAAKWLGGTIATPTVTGVPEVDVTHWLGTAAATPSVAGVPEVDVTHVGGTAQTAGDVIADTNDIQARLPAALVSGKIDASVSDIVAAGLDDFFADSRTGILNAGTAAAIAAGSITLAAGHGLPATTKDCLVYIRSATTGKGQTRVITSLSGDVASISPNWDTTPTGTITYAVFAAAPLTAAMEARLAELDAANLPTDVAGVQADTDNIQTRIPAALVGGRMDASVGAMAAGVVTAAAIATGAVDADALATDAVAEIADGLLNRTRAGGANGGRTVAECLAFGRNRWAIAAGTLTVYADDDTTPLYTAAVTTAAGDPVTQVDPT